MSDNTTDVLRRQHIAVDVYGERVRIQLNKQVAVVMFPNDALKLAAWIRLQAKLAKRISGDSSRQWRTLGVIEDAEEAYKKGWK